MFSNFHLIIISMKMKSFQVIQLPYEIIISKIINDFHTKSNINIILNDKLSHK